MRLYWILNKDGEMERFKLNWAQIELHRTAHTRNNILKVRQLGISTYMAMRILDACLFNDDFNAGIIDKTLDDATSKLRKIKFAFDNLDYLPPNPTKEDELLAGIGKMFKEQMKGANFTQGYAEFPNGSRITVGTSLRGSTLQLLHVSELGSVSVHDPMRAEEIVTGSLNAVGKGGKIFLESTHEGGKYGKNYELLMQAMDCIGKELAPLDMKFYFFPWYTHPEYQLEAKYYQPTHEDEAYFNKLERERGISIDAGKRAWYCSIKRTQGSKMKQEYPSTPEEAINPIMEGTIYADQVGMLREAGLLKAKFEVDRHSPVYASWDIGVGDYMSIWWIQPGNDGKWHVLDCYTANNKDLKHYVNELRRRDAMWGVPAACVTPHDGSRRDFNLVSFDESLRKEGYRVIRVPRTNDIWADIDATRDFLTHCMIHERCSEPTVLPGEAGQAAKYISGVDALTNYRVDGAGAKGVLKKMPLHDECSHACDALRCFAVAVRRRSISVHGLGLLGGMARRPEAGCMNAFEKDPVWKGHQSKFVRDYVA